MTKPNPNAPNLKYPEEFKKFKSLGFSRAFDATYQMQQYHGWFSGAMVKLLQPTLDELARAGYLNANGRAFSASSVKSMLKR